MDDTYLFMQTTVVTAHAATTTTATPIRAHFRMSEMGNIPKVVNTDIKLLFCKCCVCHPKSSLTDIKNLTSSAELLLQSVFFFQNEKNSILLDELDRITGWILHE